MVLVGLSYEDASEGLCAAFCSLISVRAGAGVALAFNIGTAHRRLAINP